MNNNKYKLLFEGRKLYNKIYTPLIKTLNTIHNNNEKFEWTIFINYWLNSLIFFYIQNVNKKFFDYKFKKKYKIINSDYLDFYKMLSDKKFNFFFLYMLNNLKLKKLDYFLNFIYGKEIELHYKKNLKLKLKIFFYKIFNNFFNHSLYINLPLSKKLRWIFFLKSNFKLLFFNPIDNIKYKSKKKNCDILNRKKAYEIFLELAKDKNLDKNLIKLLFIFLPFSYLENFENLKFVVKDIKKIKPSNVIVDGVETYNEPLKLSISYWVSNGSKLYNVQHSANHLNLKLHSFYSYWTKFSHKYITWGWKNENSKIIGLPSIRIYSRIKDIHSSKNKKYDIIFFPRENLKYPHHSLHLDQNIQKKNLEATLKILKFFNHKKYSFNLKTRHEDEKVIKKKFKNIKILNNVNNSTDLYGKTKLSIFNHLSTGFFECLYSSQPAIIYLPNKNFLNYESKSYKIINSILNKYKLIFDNPSEIIKLLENYDPVKFDNIYSKILKNNNFKNIFFKPINVEKKWTNFFKKN
jgi:putative transferase (TIGR04331 family)